MGVTFEQAVEMYREIVTRFSTIEGKNWGVKEL